MWCKIFFVALALLFCLRFFGLLGDFAFDTGFYTLCRPRALCMLRGINTALSTVSQKDVPLCDCLCLRQKSTNF